MRKPTIKVGDKFGYLTVIGIQRNNNRTLCTCQCICGEIVTRRQDYLHSVKISNKKVIQSCICQKYIHIRGNKHPQWKGCGDLSGEYMASVKCQAKKRNIEYNITIDYVWQLFLEQNQKCAMTQIPLHISQSRTMEKPQTASLDRIDSNKGYIEGNVHWVHKDINLMKNHFSMDYFIQMCKLVAENNKSSFPT